MSFGLAHLFGFEPLVAVGVVLVGSAPGGSTSNLLTYWARGNVALSIAMTSVSTLSALFMLPLNFLIYIQTGFAKDAGIELPIANIFLSLLAIIIPTCIGMYIRRANITLCSSSSNPIVVHVFLEKAANVIAAVFLVGAAAAGIMEDTHLFNPATYPKEWGLGALFQPLGCGVGFLLALAARLEGPDIRAVSLETGIQNYPLVLALASISFSGCQYQLISRFIIIGTFWWLISSIWIVSVFRFLQPGGRQVSEALAIPADPSALTDVKTSASEMSSDHAFPGGSGTELPSFTHSSGEPTVVLEVQ